MKTIRFISIMAVMMPLALMFNSCSCSGSSKDEENKAEKEIVEEEEPQEEVKQLSKEEILFEQGYDFEVKKQYQKAVEYYLKVIDLNPDFAEAYFRVGILYEHGLGMDKNLSDAFKYYYKAAELKFPNALFSVASCYEDGKGVEKDEAEAVRYMTKAAETGYALAQARLGYYYYYGIGVKKDYDLAYKYYRKAANQGEAHGEYGVGFCYASGCGTEKMTKKRPNGFRWLPTKVIHNQSVF